MRLTRICLAAIAALSLAPAVRAAETKAPSPPKKAAPAGGPRIVSDVEKRLAQFAAIPMSADTSALSPGDRKAAASLRSEILNSNCDKLETFVETANLMYIVAENMIGASVYLETVTPAAGQ